MWKGRLEHIVLIRLVLDVGRESIIKKEELRLQVKLHHTNVVNHWQNRGKKTSSVKRKVRRHRNNSSCFECGL